PGAAAWPTAQQANNAEIRSKLATFMACFDLRARYCPGTTGCYDPPELWKCQRSSSKDSDPRCVYYPETPVRVGYNEGKVTLFCWIKSTSPVTPLIRHSKVQRCFSRVMPHVLQSQPAERAAIVPQSRPNFVFYPKAIQKI